MLRFSPAGARVEARRAGSFLGMFGKSEDFGGEVLDVSGLGLRFVSMQKLALNTRLKIVLTFKQASEPLSCHAVVRWAHAHSQQNQYVVGVEFESLSGDQVQLLDKVQKTSI